MRRVIVLGIDPGSRRCGYGVVARRGTRLELVESGVLVPGERPMAERLARILDGLDEVIARAWPAEVSVEQVFAGVSPRSALVLGQARGVALAAAARAGLPVYEYAPSEVKLAFTGQRPRLEGPDAPHRAHAARRRPPALSDEADAIALAVCHLARRAARLAAGRRRRRPGRRPRAAPPRAPRPPGRSVIARLSGKVAEKGADHAVLDVGGVGYLVHLSAVSLAALPPEGSPATLRTFTNVRQDAIDLFGFATEEEEAVFRALIDVKGVGPRAAQNILSGIEAQDLAQAIAQGDVARLTRCPASARRPPSGSWWS